MSENTPLAELSLAGVSIWLDDLSRDRIKSGNLADLIANRHISGVTTNPTIFAGAHVGIEHFGASADYQTLYREFGLTADAVVAAAQSSIAAAS